MMKKLLTAALLCALVLACCPALAGGAFTLDVDALDMSRVNSDDYVAAMLTAQCQGIDVRKAVSDSSELAESVRLTITQMNTHTLLFDRDYGYQSGYFDSGVVYLPLADGTVPYLITLYVGQQVYAFPFMHQGKTANSSKTQKADTDSGYVNPGWVDETVPPDAVVSSGWADSSDWQDPATGWEEGAGWD